MNRRKSTLPFIFIVICIFITASIVLTFYDMNKWASTITLLISITVSMFLSKFSKLKTVKNPKNIFVILFYKKNPILGSWKGKAELSFFKNDEFDKPDAYTLKEETKEFIFNVVNNKWKLSFVTEKHQITEDAIVCQSHDDQNEFYIHYSTGSISSDDVLKKNNPTHIGAGKIIYNPEKDTLTYVWWTNRHSGGTILLKRK